MKRNLHDILRGAASVFNAWPARRRRRSQLRRLRRRIVASGAPRLDWDGVDREVCERRGDRTGYQHVPLAIDRTVRTRYVHQGRGEPRRCTLDGDAQCPTWLKRVEAALTALLDLESDWDSYGADPVAQSCVDAARRIIRASAQRDAPEPAVVPTTRGGVGLGWHTGGIDLEIGIHTPHRATVVFEDDRTGEKWERVYNIAAGRPGHVVAIIERVRAAVAEHGSSGTRAFEDWRRAQRREEGRRAQS